ncbi:aldose 1-epimerase family protein [soil metagenome]
MRIDDTELTRADVLRRVGSLAQVGGVQLMAYEEGHARGTRALEFRTGTGLRFVVEPDRGFDVGFAEFGGTGLCWLPSKGLAGPWYYEGDLDDHAWLRVGLGGLFNTAGLVSMGTPQTVPTESFGFTQRLAARYGTHDRIAVTPASTFAHGADWEGDRCRLWATGTVRQEIAYGEHLSLTRRYETEIGASSFRIHDRVTNEGWFEAPHQLLYHVNLGFPLLGDGAEVLAATSGDPDDLSFSTKDDAGGAATRWRSVTDPVAGFTHEGYIVPMRPDAEGWVSVAIVNRRLRPEIGGLGVYLRYDARTLPVYVAWRMMREGLYAIGFEPSTTPFGATRDLIAQGYPLMMAPGEEREYHLELGILAGSGAIEDFQASLPA